MSRIVYSPTIFVTLHSHRFFLNGMDLVMWVFHNSVCKNMTHKKHFLRNKPNPLSMAHAKVPPTLQITQAQF